MLRTCAGASYPHPPLRGTFSRGEKGAPVRVCDARGRRSRLRSAASAPVAMTVGDAVCIAATICSTRGPGVRCGSMCSVCGPVVFRLFATRWGRRQRRCNGAAHEYADKQSPTVDVTYTARDGAALAAAFGVALPEGVEVADACLGLWRWPMRERFMLSLLSAVRQGACCLGRRRQHCRLPLSRPGCSGTRLFLVAQHHPRTQHAARGQAVLRQ